MPLAAAKMNPYFMQRAANPSFPNGSQNAGQYTLVFRIRHKTTKTLFYEHSLILMPQRFAQTTESRTNLYYTKGAIIADTPTPTGVGLTFFHITGHTGYHGVVASTPTPGSPVTPAAFLETVQNVAQNIQTLFTVGPTATSLPLRGSLIDGAAAIKDFQEMFLRYFDPMGDVPVVGMEGPGSMGVTQTNELQLEFLNLTAPTSAQDPTGHIGWIIHPHRNLVDIQQDASKPFLYQYNFQFAAIAPLATPVPDVFLERITNPKTGFQETLQKLTDVVTSITNGINTIEDAMTQMVIQNVTGPVSTFVLGCATLGDALANFLNSAAAKILFPLYAQRTFAHVLDTPRHSVTTLAEAAKQLAAFLVEAADPRSIGRTLAGETLVGGTLAVEPLTGGANDELTLSLNNEPPITLHLGTQTSGPAIAATIQALVQAHPPTYTANAAAYRDFAATFTDGQYRLSSGTKFSDVASVRVVVNNDVDLTPADASAILGLGVANGGQEHVGSAYPLPAVALLRGVEEACAHLQAFPDFFADQLEAQDSALVALLPAGVTRPQIRGDQRLQQTRITPGDSLQGIAARVGVPWETLALVNRLTYPYILEEPTTLARGRVSSADRWQITDVVQAWPVDVYQGQRLDITAGIGAGQSRRILRNTLTQLVLDQAWDVVPTDTSDYAIRSAANPILRTGTITTAGARTVTNGALTLVPNSQRGLTLLVTSGPTAGASRRVVANDATTYSLERDWEVVPSAGSLYLLIGPAPATRRQLLPGELLSVPRPSAQALTPMRSRLHDVSAITGRHTSVEEQLFGRDLVLDLATQSLVYDPALGDAVSVAGLPNLRQALVHYINLPLGELEYDPGLGSFVAEELGLSATLPLQTQLLASVQRTIKQDHRIARMDSARLVTQGGTTVIVFGATAVDGSTVDRIMVR